jgi:hypothetical protein
MQIETRVISVMVLPVGEPIFSEMASSVRIEDEANGEHVVVEQHGRADIGKISINPDEWPSLREAINNMIAQCRPAS